ncbi:nitroreductase family protein, partial [bacterium]|nr:nitroreductase family protein [bacterium]
TEETVRDLAEAACLAASCFNNQPWRFVFVREREVLERLFETLPDGNAWARAASMIVAVISRADLDCQIMGRDYFLFDTGMATAQMILRASELGLVAHPIAGYSPKKVRGVLGIPDDLTVITLVIVGKHTDEISDLLSEEQAASEARRPERRPFEEIAWMDAYGG